MPIPSFDTVVFAWTNPENFEDQVIEQGRSYAVDIYSDESLDDVAKAIVDGIRTSAGNLGLRFPYRISVGAIVGSIGEITPGMLYPAQDAALEGIEPDAVASETTEVSTVVGVYAEEETNPPAAKKKRASRNGKTEEGEFVDAG